MAPASLRYTWAEELEKWVPILGPNDISVICKSQDFVRPVRQYRSGFESADKGLRFTKELDRSKFEDSCRARVTIELKHRTCKSSALHRGRFNCSVRGIGNISSSLCIYCYDDSY